MSKVRCSKEKPTCARCLRRCTTCEYFVTKRPGRKQQEKPPAPVVTSSIPPTLPELDRPMTVTLPEQGLLSVQDDTTSPSCSHTFSSLFDQAEASLSSSLTTWSTDFDDYLTPFSLGGSAALDAFDIGSTSHPGGINPSISISSNSSTTGSSSAIPPEETISLFGRPASMSHSQVLFPTDTADEGKKQPRPHGSPCSCLPCALDLLKRLAATDSAPVALTDKINHRGQAQSLDTTITTNQQIMDTIEVILQCSCSQDSYLLAIVSLVIFKSLDRYAAAASPAREPFSSRGSTLRSLGVESEPIDDAELDSCMVAAHRVLGELHRVQRCCNGTIGAGTTGAVG
ncbi:hypothetical protein EYZ11_006298 [Aspergillus tanneri]|uniref:Aflatoxin regulatory protein domain-containing protein n=1 Tax=Aspergillus tanneri TaxID=1220188 RepID=A0A4S3JI59_9EURO|nr:hypothetical protein EYZ11_006298 [Aspergillus tanneri]